MQAERNLENQRNFQGSHDYTTFNHRLQELEREQEAEADSV